MWTTVKRVRVPSITPAEALTVEASTNERQLLRRECEFSARSHTPGHAGATPASATMPP